MIKNWIPYCFLLLASCSAEESKFEMFGVTDLTPVTSPMCVWLNGEPVLSLVPRSTFPRIANSYPIIKGQNIVKVTPMILGQRLEGEIKSQNFFYANNSGEKTIKLTWSHQELEYLGAFEALGNYSDHEVGSRVQADTQTEELAKNWTWEYLEAIRKKDSELLPKLFVADPSGEDWYEPVQLLFAKDSKCTSLLAKNEFIIYRGRSLVLVCHKDKLAEWRIGNTNRIFDYLLFGAFDGGIYLWVSGGKWVKINSK